MTVATLQARLYPDPFTRDPVQQFVAELERYVGPEHEVLDLGAGAGQINHYSFRGRVARMVGVDLDPRVCQNPLLDEGRVGDIQEIPFVDNSFDIAFAIYVLEHLADPARFVNEVRRVLRPGGHFLALTPNRFHYVSVASTVTPTSFHKWYNKRRGRDEDDTFPTFYRLNTCQTLTRHFQAGGFETAHLRTIEVQPNYLKFSRLAFLLGAAYERLVNSTQLLSSLRVNIIAAFRNGPKPDAPS